MVFRKLAVAHLLLFGGLELLDCVRLSENADDELWEGDEAVADSSEDACTEALRPVFRTSTYTDLFSPIFDGVYRIRSHSTGKYLTGTKEGFVGTSLHHPSKDNMQWTLKRVKPKKDADSAMGVRKFTLQNKASGLYLVLGEGQLFSFKEANSGEAYWKLRRTEDGTHEVFESAASGSSGSEAITENSSGHVTVSPYQGEKSEWFLDLQLSFWRIPRSDSSGYVKQWKEVASIPMWAGSNISWYKMCEDSLIKCDEGYGKLRQTYKELGYLAENHRRIVSENNLKVCDASWGLMKGVYSTSASFLYAARKTGGEACAGRDLKNISFTMKRIMAEDCFDSCIAASTEELKDVPCHRPDNVTNLFERVYTQSACDNLPPRSAMRVMNYVLVTKCTTWHETDPMFMRETHDVNSLTYYDGDEVCAVDSKTRNWKKIERRGVCPSGTTCQCPRTYLTTPKTARQLEFTGMILLKDSDLTLAGEVWGQVTRNARRVLITVLLRGSTLKAAVLALPGGFTFWPRIALATFGWARRAVSWKCAASVGCWPVRPHRVKTQDTPKACRIPDEARTGGGSKVWFMPPPGVIVRHRKWYLFRRCEFTKCEVPHMMQEKVGFFKRDDNDKHEGKPNIYNCQRLGFEDMDEEQQRLYLERLRETVPAEYADQIRDD